MSLDGGYIGSLDHAIANLHIGRQQGYQQGIEDGYQQGFDEGRSTGWNEAMAVAQEKLREQQTYTYQHYTEKERLKAELEQLQQQLADLDAKYQEKSKVHTAMLWQYNRSLVVLAAARQVLEVLTSEDTPQAKRVRELFAERYAHHVSHALKDGVIKAPPEHDAEFAESLPKTREFILNTLQSVGRQNGLPTAEPGF